jgi:predicted dienelactone hydrolase
MGRLEAEGFLTSLVDTSRTALLGYSMGGYGVLNTAGAGISQTGVTSELGVPGGKLSIRQMGRPEYNATLDPRVRAIAAFAPWGYPQFFDWEGLGGLEVPSLFIIGSMDTTSGYENVKAIFEAAVHSDRYLLVYQNGDHEIAVNPAPALAASNFQDYLHYQEPAWDNTRCNNINQHFITAFLDHHLKGGNGLEYLNVPTPIANQAVWSIDEHGRPGESHTYWKGFKRHTLIGLEIHHLAPLSFEERGAG